ncbi:hypothetical protein CDIK_1883 [Cucumispora dikerogammari]|nr:hypothetical protein CDIK_1883 [Cucumispora dikerogammari]
MFAIISHSLTVYCESDSFFIKEANATIQTECLGDKTLEDLKIKNTPGLYSLEYSNEIENLFVKPDICIGSFGDNIKLIDSLIVFVIYIKDKNTNTWIERFTHTYEKIGYKYTFTTCEYRLKQQGRTVFGISQTMSVNTKETNTNKRISPREQKKLFAHLLCLRFNDLGDVAYTFKALFTIKDKTTDVSTKISAETDFFIFDESKNLFSLLPI